MGSGIYKIVNLLNGKIYIGSAVDFKNRWRNHLYRLRKGNHHSAKLQNSWNKHGEDGFEFIEVELVAPGPELLVREQFWIDLLKPIYNTRPNASSQLGFKHKPSTLEKMAMAGANISDETREKMRAAKLGRKASEETKAKMSLLRKGKPVHTEASKRLLAQHATGNKNSLGKTHSAEARAAISRARKGKPLSEEHRRKLSESHKGLPGVASLGMLGKKHSEATKEKMAISQRKRFSGSIKCGT